MKNFLGIAAVAMTVGTAVILAGPASAMPSQHSDQASPIIKVASGGWSSRIAGNRSTYEPGYGYQGGYAYQGGYGYPGYGDVYRRGPYGQAGNGYGAPAGLDYGYDDEAY